MLSEIELRKHIDKIVLWIQDYVNKVGAKGVVIGNSGGKDSATVIALASLALGKEKVLTVGMPCQSRKGFRRCKTSGTNFWCKNFRN